MTDEERNQIFAAKSREIIDELLGKDAHYESTINVHEKFTDYNWSSGKPFYDRPRVLKQMNPHMSDYFGYYERLRQNGYVDVTVEKHDEPISEAVKKDA